jgi:predicted nucleic acid-binding protein
MSGIDFPDAIIAATAIEYNLPLISSDDGFSTIKELDFIFLEKS